MKIEDAAKELQSKLGLYDWYEECEKKNMRTVAPFNREAVRTLLSGYEVALKVIAEIHGCDQCENGKDICDVNCYKCEQYWINPENKKGLDLLWKWRGPELGGEGGR